MDFGSTDTPMIECGWEVPAREPFARKPTEFRSDFARALHCSDKPQMDDAHKTELRNMEKALRAFASGESMEEIKGQLEGQRALVKRVKTNLKDNRSKLRATLKALKAARKRLAPLEDHINIQRKALFEKSMTIDSQRVEIDCLRNALDAASKEKHKFSVAHATLARLSQDNQMMKDEILDLRIRNRELEACGPTGQDILKSLNNEIAALKAEKTDYQSEIDFLKTENKAAQDRQTELMGELIELRKTAPMENASGLIETAQIRLLSDKLQAASERETLLEKRLEILTRDLDIVHQTNDMLRGRISKMETLDRNVLVLEQERRISA